MTHEAGTLYYGFVPAKCNQNPVKKNGLFEIGAVDHAGTSAHVKLVKGFQAAHDECGRMNVDLDNARHGDA